MILFKTNKKQSPTETNVNTDIDPNIYFKNILKENCFEEISVLTICY